MNLGLALAAALAAMAAPAARPALAQTSPEAERVIDRYFENAGGRDRWAAAAGEYVLAVTSDPQLPLPYSFEFCWSFREPRTAERARFQNRTQRRGFEKGAGWSYRRDLSAAAGTLRRWSADENELGDSIWRGAFEVVLHRLAARDPALNLRMGLGSWEGYVEVLERGAPIGRLLTDAKGNPLRYHRPADNTRVVFGPLVDRGGYLFPEGGAFEAGATFRIIALELLPKEPTDAYAMPLSSDDGRMPCNAR